MCETDEVDVEDLIGEEVEPDHDLDLSTFVEEEDE